MLKYELILQLYNLISFFSKTVTRNALILESKPLIWFNFVKTLSVNLGKKIQNLELKRHFWKKNPKFIFFSDYVIQTDNLWRHINLKLHQLGYLYVTWPQSRDVISVRYHVMKVITPEKPGTELASFLEKKSRRVWEPLGASFMEKNPKNGFFG